MKENTNKQNWQKVELGELLNYEQPGKYIVSSEDYDDKYKTPVLTAGKSFILGYTNETEGVYENLPVIIFDDFTTASHLVDFKFKVKSSAMKMLTPKRKDVDLKFIFLLMQTIKFSSETHKRYYLSTYQHRKILLPPLPVQKKIVSILEKAEKLKQKREEADKLTNEYLKSVFNEMFLKYKKNSEIIKSVNEICTLVRGSSPRPQGDPKYYGGDVPRLMVSDITRDGMYTTPKIDFLTEEGAKLSRPMKKGEVIMAVSGNPGLPTILDVDACIHDGFVGFRNLIEEIEPEYLYYYLLANKDKNNSQSVGAIFRNLNTDQIKKWQIVIPQIRLQKKFIEIAEKVEKLKEKQKESKEKINEMLDALMQKAFRGEL